jgi:N,N'-diacetyllegionaminate synthase
MRVFVIAEAANTWRIGRVDEQHLRYARKAIVTAKAAGADAVKFQWTSDPTLMAERRTVLSDTYTILAWPAAWLPLLAKECERVDIEFMCSVFLAKDVATIAPFVQRFKVASLECQDEALVAEMEQHRITTVRGPIPYKPSPGAYIKPIYVSVGAAERSATPAYGALLHCCCAYPAPLSQMNLAVLRRHDYHGLSDHTGDVLTGAVAVGAGAEIIEVHFRLDETRKDNPDYLHSHSPNRLVEYIMNVRKAEIMLGDGVKKIEECEKPLLKHRVHA